MPNQITIAFETCSPSPANGYRIRFRPAGTVPFFTVSPNVFVPPAVFIDDQSGADDGEEYEGFIQGDCGGGVYGGEIPWSTGVDPECVAVAISGTPNLPNIEAGDPYAYVINLTGTAPFDIVSVIKPAWMTITVVGSTIQFGGTPDAGDVGTAIPVSFTVRNCIMGAPDTQDFSDTLNVTASDDGLLLLSNNSTSMVVEDIEPAWFFISDGEYPIASGQTLSGVHGAYAGNFGVEIIFGTGRIRLLQNGIQTACMDVVTPGTITFTGVNILAGDYVEIILENGNC